MLPCTDHTGIHKWPTCPERRLLFVVKTLNVLSFISITFPNWSPKHSAYCWRLINSRGWDIAEGSQGLLSKSRTTINNSPCQSFTVHACELEKGYAYALPIKTGVKEKRGKQTPPPLTLSGYGYWYFPKGSLNDQYISVTSAQIFPCPLFVSCLTEKASCHWRHTPLPTVTSRPSLPPRHHSTTNTLSRPESARSFRSEATTWLVRSSTFGIFHSLSPGRLLSH